MKIQVDPKYRSFYYQDVETYPELNLDPKTTALLLVDLQNEFAHDEMGEALELKKEGTWDRWKYFRDRLKTTTIPNARRLLDYFRDHELRVTFGRIACLLTDGEDRETVQKSDGWNGIFIHADSTEAAMVEELTPQDNELVFNKTTDSVTTGTNICRILRNMGIKTVVVGGIVTDQCVAGTVRGLADDSFQVICVEDACAAATQELHDAELKIMNLIYCQVLSTDQTIALLDEAREKHAK
ncbi:MAG: cysteine hydrolase [Negativicoccus massiliensis]|uniref:cysteine hydrolase family protein n=1 Tax=Negativicoccus succinicivorans TaxID=620903 RepID=UPI0026E968FA|nr:cysteine hydrolase [Negativicoccus succinicivorans]MBS5887530.1 cysteine hydrolase [Negativicoccus succinicivorans]MDU3214475.1 cysteine hydrolase [Negativicoccus succinicivorans]MDU4641682.1 cysteine hydrolase [Negativicoccus massiliensis]MDU5027213.1 cysteine hydrolase [Negativicoccus succinicivorans]